ncbi:hypothetical protein OCA08_09405 [Bacillus cereus]|nr:hypothetical protein [Bacillus cereus]
MLEIKEEDLGFFQITNKNRLSPDGVMAFLVGVFVYASLPMFFYCFWVFTTWLGGLSKIF